MGFAEEILKATEREEYNDELVQDGLDMLRPVMATAPGMKDPEVALLPAKSRTCSSSVRAHLLQAWAVRANDPAAFVAAWFFDGAPGGILTDMPDMSMLWERKEDDGKTKQADDLELDAAAHQMDPHIQDASSIHDTVQKLIDNKFVDTARKHNRAH